MGIGDGGMQISRVAQPRITAPHEVDVRGVCRRTLRCPCPFLRQQRRAENGSPRRPWHNRGDSNSVTRAPPIAFVNSKFDIASPYLPTWPLNSALCRAGNVFFNNYHIFHTYSLRKTLTCFVFNNFCSGLKVDIFSTCVFNNFCRHTFKFKPPFFPARPSQRKAKLFFFNCLAAYTKPGHNANCICFHQHSLRKTLL